MSLLLVCVLTSILVLVAVLAPFYVGKGGRLAPASSINDLSVLENLRASIVRRYVSEEQSFNEKLIGEATWKKRREFLENKYIDVTRRYDFIKRLEESGGDE